MSCIVLIHVFSQIPEKTQRRPHRLFLSSSLVRRMAQIDSGARDRPVQLRVIEFAKRELDRRSVVLAAQVMLVNTLGAATE
jgi:hypothetical protein